MMAHLTSTAHEPERDAASSRAILLLDFRKAYDTVSRESLFEVMRAFGFEGALFTMVRHLHTNTTGEIYSKWHSIRPRTCSHRDPTGLSVSAISIPADSRNPSHRIVTNAHGSRTAASPISRSRAEIICFCR